MLVELVASMAIFSIIFVSLVSIWANAHRNLINSFRKTYYKSSVSVAIKQIGSDISNSSRIEYPPYTPGTATMGQALVAVSNVDKTGCFPRDPIIPNTTTLPQGVTWYIYCMATDSASNSYLQNETTLYYYTGLVPQSYLNSHQTNCPPTANTLWQNLTYYITAGDPTVPANCNATNTISLFGVSSGLPVALVTGVARVGNGSGYSFFRRDAPDRVYTELDVVKPVMTTNHLTDKPFAVYTTAEFRLGGNYDYP